MMPRATPLSVRWSTRTASAVAFTQVPETEISWPTKNSRKFLDTCIEEKVLRTSSANRDMLPAYEAARVR